MVRIVSAFVRLPRAVARRSVMGKLIPTWVLLLCLLLGSLCALGFGWIVKNAVEDRQYSVRFGAAGDAAVFIASLPDEARNFIHDVTTDSDIYLRVPQGTDLVGFHPIRIKRGIDLHGILVRADEAALARA